MDYADILELDSSDPLPREALGGFNLVRKMASGGMANVYLGHRRGPSGLMQVAAIKVMLPSLVKDAEYVEMFFDEARLTSAMKHPYVCRVLDYGVKEGFHYLATEYVLGETWGDLADVLHKTPEGKAVAPLLLAHIAAKACEGLHAVHETCDDRGKHLAIVHRDISPQNIMVCYDGSVRLLDFGIASAAERLHETRNGVLKGHAAYMAPEQVQIQAVDRRCDLWALGVMLWEGVAGRRLFKRANNRDTMKAVTSDPLALLLREGEPLPAPLMAVVERSVVRDPNARFPTAHDMGLELSNLRLGVAPMTSEQVASWMRRLFAERFNQKRQQLRSAIGLKDDPSEVSQSTVRMAETAKKRADPSATHVTAAPSPDLVSASKSYPRRHLAGLRLPHWLTARTAAATAFAMSIAVAATLMSIRSTPAGGSSVPEKPLQPVAPAKAQNQGPPGTLEVLAPGRKVRVTLQGRDLGVPPLRVELPPGKHVLRIIAGAEAAATDAPVVIESGASYVMEVEGPSKVAPPKTP